MEDVHFPPGSPGAIEAEAAAKAAEEAASKEATDKAAAEAAAADEAKAKEAEEATKVEAEAKAKAEEEAQNLNKKPRSIYDDYKDKKKEANEAKERADAEQARADAAEAELAKLRGGKKSDADPSKKDDAPADDLEAFAKEKGYDPSELERLTEILAKRIPTPQLSEAEKTDLAELRGWKAAQEAKDKRAAEDAVIQADAPSVQKQFSISDAGELTAVMAEIVRLAHTPKYADKEVDYILFKEKDALSKLVSPKKPSFESGADVTAPEAETEVDLSKGGVTPEMAQKANQPSSRTQLEHRKAQ